MASGLRRWCVRACVLLVLAASTVAADATDDRRALVMLRVLAYDKHLGDRVGDDITVMIAYPATDQGNLERARWTAAFGNVSGLKVGSRSVSVISHRFEDAQKLDHELATSHAAALVVCDGLTRSISVQNIVAATRARKVLTLSTREAEVVKGLAVGIVPGSKKDEIVVNVTAATAEGVKFDAGLLQLARTVEDQP